MNEKISKGIQGLEFAIFSLMVPYGEHIQNEVLLKNAEYTWAVGHVTDIGYSGALTVVAVAVSKAEDKLRNALLVPTAMSAFEVMLSFHPRIGFDWQDVACYYGAALFAYGVNKIVTTDAKTQ